MGILKTIHSMFLTLALATAVLAPEQKRPKVPDDTKSTKAKESLRASAKPGAAGATASEVDSGEIVGRTYTNHYFGLHLTLPLGWARSNKAVKKNRCQEMARLIEVSPQEREQFCSGQGSDVGLDIEPSPSPVGKPNLLFGCTWSPFQPDQMPLGQRLKVGVVTALMPNLIKAEVDRDVRTILIGGKEFVIVSFKLSYEAEKGPVNLGKFALCGTSLKGYWLILSFRYEVDEQLNILDEILNSVTFDRNIK